MKFLGRIECRLLRQMFPWRGVQYVSQSVCLSVCQTHLHLVKAAAQIDVLFGVETPDVQGTLY